MTLTQAQRDEIRYAFEDAGMQAQWSSKCDLCASTHRMQDGSECPWCKGVRLEYGNYFYPINASNAHLFKPQPVQHILSDKDIEEIRSAAFEAGRKSATYYGA